MALYQPGRDLAQAEIIRMAGNRAQRSCLAIPWPVAKNEERIDASRREWLKALIYSAISVGEMNVARAKGTELLAANKAWQ